MGMAIEYALPLGDPPSVAVFCIASGSDTEPTLRPTSRGQEQELDRTSDPNQNSV